MLEGENAAMLAVKDSLPEGCTTVGGHIESSHLKPSKIGDVVRAEAEAKKVDVSTTRVVTHIILT